MECFLAESFSTPKRCALTGGRDSDFESFPRQTMYLKVARRTSNYLPPPPSKVVHEDDPPFPRVPQGNHVDFAVQIKQLTP
eukprot:763864-Hanusia_phi.AAC.1